MRAWGVIMILVLLRLRSFIMSPYYNYFYAKYLHYYDNPCIARVCRDGAERDHNEFRLIYNNTLRPSSPALEMVSTIMYVDMAEDAYMSPA